MSCTGAETQRLRRCRSSRSPGLQALLEDRQEAIGPGRVVSEQPRQLGAGVARVPAHLEKTGLGGVGIYIVGGRVAAFEMLAAALAHAEPDQQHEQVPQGRLAGRRIAHAGGPELAVTTRPAHPFRRGRCSWPP